MTTATDPVRRTPVRRTPVRIAVSLPRCPYCEDRPPLTESFGQRYYCKHCRQYFRWVESDSASAKSAEDGRELYDCDKWSRNRSGQVRRRRAKPYFSEPIFCPVCGQEMEYRRVTQQVFDDYVRYSHSTQGRAEKKYAAGFYVCPGGCLFAFVSEILEKPNLYSVGGMKG